MPATSPHRTGWDRRFVLLLSCGQLISWGSVFYLFALLLEPLEAELGHSRAAISLAFSLGLLMEGALGFAVGRWIDRGFERRVMSLGSAVLALGLLGLSQVHTVSELYLAWLVLGAGLSATLYSPAFAIVTRRFPTEFRRAIIMLTFLGGLASTVFIPFMAWLFHQLGWRHALWVLAGLHAGVCLPLHAWLLRPAGGPPSHTAPATATTTAMATALPAKPGASDTGRWQDLLHAPVFWMLGVFTVLMMGVTTALPAHLIALLRERGLSDTWAVAIPASIGALQVLGRALLYVTERRLDVHAANRLIPGLIPLGLLALLAASQHPWAVWAFVVLYGLGNGMVTIVKGTAMAHYVSHAHMATLNGLLALPSALARAAAPWLLGVLWTPAGGYTVSLWLLLALSLTAVAALIAVQRLAGGRHPQPL
jgi:MFS family permease